MLSLRRENNTPEDLDDPEIPEESLENQERSEDQRNPEDLNNSKDDKYLPLEEEKDSLEAEDFTIPENLEDQESFRQQLIATTRSLKAKECQLKVEQDTLNNRWTKVLSARKDTTPVFGINPKATHADGCCHSSTTKFPLHHLPNTPHTTSQTALPEDGTGRLGTPITDRQFPEGE